MTGRADARICQSFQDGLPAMGHVRYHAAIGVPPTLIRRKAILRVAARLLSPPTRRKPLMSIIKEFKEFAVKGNVMDLAVGVIIGGAFSKIVDSVVKDLIMPVIGVLTGGLDFSNKFVLLGTIPPTFKGNPDSFKDLQAAGVAAFGYGSFITVAINFVILAFIIFLMVKFINKLRKPEEAAPAATPEDTVLLREIRDSLKQR
ncbi:UNVERIFIED_ORG: large conductance mechanosensitive channel [Burkholderia cepacia]|nr:large conductance mechanosensitive channel [Burkholderia cepacia]MDP9593739.1 large conductance mechanosensitive channel [Burkholderia cepacia]MDP9621337.1 large conductance mechanosensitive channel [Burkholderia cepacia]MDP9667401.1 large conductance mechanosensitive channel [Burkholderia cepacia]MDP9715003.1 large conductance mechanosensitive channel [Burkholderia cepacia]